MTRKVDIDVDLVIDEEKDMDTEKKKGRFGKHSVNVIYKKSAQNDGALGASLPPTTSCENVSKVKVILYPDTQATHPSKQFDGFRRGTKQQKFGGAQRAPVKKLGGF